MCQAISHDRSKQIDVDRDNALFHYLWLPFASVLNVRGRQLLIAGVMQCALHECCAVSKHSVELTHAANCASRQISNKLINMC